MSITKIELVNQVQASHSGLSKVQARAALEAVLQTIKTSLASGEDVLLTGFGRFNVRGKSARRGRNPKTGEAMMLADRRVVTFKASGKLRQKVNGSSRFF